MLALLLLLCIYSWAFHLPNLSFPIYEMGITFSSYLMEHTLIKQNHSLEDSGQWQHSLVFVGVLCWVFVATSLSHTQDLCLFFLPRVLLMLSVWWDCFSVNSLILESTSSFRGRRGSREAGYFPLARALNVLLAHFSGRSNYSPANE